jgi:GNAT superfamily N-acetyltransferase
MQWCRDSFILTDDRPLTAAHSTFELLQSTYWAHKRPMEVVEKLLRNSLCFFLLRETNHVGFARVITDYATTSWLCDVVLDSRYRSNGLGSWMMQCVLEHPGIAHTQFALQTGTAHDFYRRLGFCGNDALMSTPVDYL